MPGYFTRTEDKREDGRNFMITCKIDLTTYRIVKESFVLKVLDLECKVEALKNSSKVPMYFELPCVHLSTA